MAFALALATGFSVPIATSAPTNSAPLHGAAIFDGREPVAAQLRGHEEILPTFATRCQNCHARDVITTALGPPLTPRSLTQLKPRRGGPESAFDLGSFCRLLRTGVDPSAIMVRSAMPVYRLSDQQCTALWLYLTVTESAP
ncbi:MAG TPA: hypothetical protein VNU71_11375 [Burkholderiaceae bacterium]|nr:hypothetical protein [Burkholderiaceae bacterium]